MGGRAQFKYDGNLARWWCRRSGDAAHARAYGKIVRFIHSSLGSAPERIIDYACGAGNLLTRLSWRFPQSRLVGIDGSSFLLDRARQRLECLGRPATNRVRLVQARLPDPRLRLTRAGLVVFAFPNMVPSSTTQDPSAVGAALHDGELAVAEALACRNDPDPSGPHERPEAILHWLMSGRLVSRDLRRLLVRGGICVRVEYAKVRRHEMSRADLMRISFEEGSLDSEVIGRTVPQWFRVLASCYYRSRVVEDVYQQTGDESDRNGGYVITVLRAL